MWKKLDVQSNLHILRRIATDTASMNQINQAFHYLLMQRESNKLLNDQRSLDSLILIYSACLAETGSIKDLSKLSIEYQFPHIAANLMTLLIDKLQGIYSNQDVDTVQKYYLASFIKITYVLLGIIKFFSEYNEFCESWVNTNGLSVLIDFINNQIIITKYFSEDLENCSLLQPIIDCILEIIVNVQPFSFDKQVNFEIFKQFNSRTKQMGVFAETQVLAFMALVTTLPVHYSFSEEDASTASKLLDLLGQASTEMTFKAVLDKETASEWNVLKLLNILKVVIPMFEENLKKNCQQVLSGLLKVLMNKQASELCEEILSLVTIEETNNNQQEHILISYFREDKDLCLAIKKDLEKLEYLVWMDVVVGDELKLDTVAKGVEKCWCVLMCVSDKYKEDVKGRSEVEYAFLLGKPIIPLIMQKDFKPSGWLGIIMGTKIFVNFTRYEYDECIRRLNNEIQSLLKTTSKSSTNNSQPPEKKEENSESTDSRNTEDVEISERIKICDWSTEELQSWLSNAHPVIKDHLRDCNGEHLWELYEMRTKAPEYFFCFMGSFVTPENAFTLKDILIFTRLMDQLFLEF